MKKVAVVFVLMLLLAGCGEQQVMETVHDEPLQQVAAPMLQVLVELPKEAALPVMENESGKLYVCEDYTICQQILPGGNLSQTLKNISGYAKEDLELMQTNWENAKRYDFVWTAAGESEEQICRACILDDGNYHYVLTATADASNAANLQEVWRKMFDSFRLVSAQMPLDTGS